MPGNLKTCTKCQSRMSDGFVVDQSHAATYAAAWHPGPILKRWLAIGGVKIDSTRQRQIAAYRCERCGFLELYAPDKS